jgi:hypothetical protein
MYQKSSPKTLSKVEPVHSTIIDSGNSMAQGKKYNQPLDKKREEDLESMLQSLDVSDNPLLSQRATFNPGNYFLLYFLHVFYYSTFGPFFFVLLIWLPAARNSLQNLLFIRLNPWCLFQNAYWASAITITIMALVLRKYRTIDEAMFYSTLMNTLFRSATISGKYGTYPVEEVQKIFHQAISANQVRGEMMIDAWRGQTEKVVRQEIESVKKRENLQKLDQNVIAEVSGAKTEVSSDRVVENLAKEFAEVNKQQLTMALVFVYAIIRTLACGLLNLWIGLPFHGEELEEKVVFYMVLVWEFMYFTVGPMFYLLAFKDIKRMLFFSNCTLSILNSGQATSTEIQRIDITDNKMESMLVLAKKLDRYGDRFVQRHRALTGFILVHCLLLEFVLISKYFDIFRISIFAQTERKLQFLLVADLITISLPLIGILALISKTNNTKKKVAEELKLHIKDKAVKFEQEFMSEMQRDCLITIFGSDLNIGFLLVISIVLLAGIGGGIFVVFWGTYKIA